MDALRVALIAPIDPKAMITILYLGDHDRWLRGSYTDVVALQQPHSTERMTVSGEQRARGILSSSCPLPTLTGLSWGQVNLRSFCPKTDDDPVNLIRVAYSAHAIALWGMFLSCSL